MQFIKVKVNEAGEVRKLAIEIWNENYREMISQSQIDYMLDTMYNLDLISEQIEEGKSWYWLENKKAKMGFTSFYPENGKMFVSKLYLLKVYQGKDYAREAINFISEQAKKLNLKYLTLNVNKYNHKAQAFYKKMGFEIVDEGVFDIGAGYVMDDYIMELKISN